MSILNESSDFLNKLIDSDVKKKLLNIYNKIDLKDEFEISFYKSEDKSKIKYESFIKVLKFLKAYSNRFKDVKIESSVNLDCSYSNIEKKESNRISINNYNLIKEITSLIYNKRNDVIFKLILSKYLSDKKNYELIKKIRNDSNIIDFKNFDLRLKMFKEDIPSEKEINYLKKIGRDESQNIIFRYKQRTSLILINNSDVNLRIDLTDVKSSKNIKNLHDSASNYELEVEFTIKKKKKNDSKYLNRIMNELKRLLMVVQESNYIISNPEKKLVLDSYKKLFSIKEDRLRFIGRQAQSLEIQHVVDIIPNKYAVTDKADGDRYLLFILKNNVYLISTNLEIKNTGIVLNKKQEKYNNTVLDGELIFLKKHNRHIFMIFDGLYFCNNSLMEENDLMKKLSYADEVINNCFILEKQNGHKMKEYKGSFNINKIIDFHNNQFERFVESLNKDISIDKKHVLIRRKYFINVFGGANNEIFKYSSILYNKIMFSNDVKMPYNLDGLIYHPLMNLQLVEYKFKPPKQNSIDFYITFERDNETNKILTLYDNSDDNLVENKEYRVINLHVGKVVKGTEYPVLFQHEAKRHLCYIYLKDGEVRDIEGNIIMDKTVVEFYYDNDSSIKNDYFRWTPIRTRFDKTESVSKYKKKYGNYITTAESVWRSIVNPFTLDDIESLADEKNYNESVEKLRKRIDHNLILSERNQNKYYKFQSNIGKLQRNFHNWIKDMLITTYCSPIDGRKVNVLGIAEGRGGDIMKFYRAKVNFMLATDVSSDVIESSTDGALSRYRKFKSQKHLTNFTKMAFLQADATVKFDYESQKKKILNMTPNNEKLLKKYFNDEKMMFDRINCQFAIHYFFRNEDCWNNFTYNINNFLKNDGYIIITCFDGDMVNNLFKEKDIYEANYTDSKGVKRTFFSLKKNYKKTDKLGLGLSLSVFLSSFMDDYETEYLVSKDFLIKELKEKCNLELVDTRLFSELYETNKNYFKNVIKYEDNLKTRDFLTNVSKYYDDMDSETEASFKLTKLNRYYVFRKLSNNKVKNEKKGGSKYVSEVEKYLGTKYKCKKKNWSSNSYYKSVYNSLIKSDYIEDVGYKNFFESLNINLNNNLSDSEIRKINGMIKLSKNKKIGGINSIIIEKSDNNKFLISSFGKKNKIIKSYPTLFMYKEDNIYSPIYKDNIDKNIHIFNSDGSFVKKILEKYNLK